MPSNDEMVKHKVLDEILVAQTRIHGKVSDLPDVFTKLDTIVGAHAVGNPIVIHHWGVSDEHGHDMDVCLPTKVAVEGDGITTTTLSVEDAMTLIHRGPYSDIGKAYTKVTRHTYERGHPIAESTREVYHHLDASKPEDTVVEVQTILHDWTHRFTTKLETVLGSKAKEEVLAPMSKLNIDSPADVRQKRSANLLVFWSARQMMTSSTKFYHTVHTCSLLSLFLQCGTSSDQLVTLILSSKQC